MTRYLPLRMRSLIVSLFLGSSISLTSLPFIRHSKVPSQKTVNRTMQSICLMFESKYNLPDWIDSLDPNIYGSAFLQRLRELQTFKNIHGDCLVPKRYTTNPTLGNFVNKIRQQYRKYQLGEKSNMTKERIAALTSIGFAWFAGSACSRGITDQKLSHSEQQWLVRFHELQQNIQQNGENMRLSSTSSLGSWTTRQRLEKKKYDLGEKSSLTPERIKLLDSINFTWEPRNTVWDLRIQDLVEFKEKFGHCVVPIQYEANPKLGTWVATQRKNYKLFQKGIPSCLTQERLNQLSSIGFVWNRWEYESEKWKM